jgi:hypothetical protein
MSRTLEGGGGLSASARLEKDLLGINQFYSLALFNGATDGMKVTPQGFFFVESDMRTLSAVGRNLMSEDSRVLDLGSGNAKAVAVFSKFAAHVTGIELYARAPDSISTEQHLYEIGADNIRSMGAQRLIDPGKITLKSGDYYAEDFSKYDRIYMYWPYTSEQAPEHAVRLEAKLASELRPDAIFILNTNGFDPKFTRLQEIDLSSTLPQLKDKVRAYRLRA